LIKDPKWEEYWLSFNFQDLNSTLNKWEVGHVLVTQILPPINVPLLSYGWIYRVISSLIENCKQYEVMIDNFLTCTCIDFVSMFIGSLGGYGKWVHCKHLYYILQILMFYGLMETFIHHPIWSWDEVHKLTSQTRTIEVEYWDVFKNNLTNFPRNWNHFVFRRIKTIWISTNSV
jgi:hypothetical protein